MVDRFTPMYAETATDRFCHMLQSPTGSFVLASDYDALAAERDALRKDAERYRWLRDSAGNDIMEKLMAECSPPRWDELVDAAIDAAMGERP